MKPLADFNDFLEFIGSFTNYERLRSFRYGPTTLGLERMRALAAAIGNPEKSFAGVHVAGTKGKGATTLILEALLRADGMLVGTYLSPHIEHISERIRVDGRSISEEALVETAGRVVPVLEHCHEHGEFPTFFELMTALAMLYFARRAVDVGILEVGLGGRLDATNILPARWSAITSIGLEHTELLGDTLEAIAREKAGIIKPRTPVVSGELPDPAMRVVAEIARERGAPLTVAPASRVLRMGRTLQIDDSLTVEAPAVRGPALRADLAIALELHRAVLGARGRTPAPDRIAHALHHLELPARVEITSGEPITCIDGAHTRESIAALRVALEEEGFRRPRTLVFSLASDKRSDAILAELPAIAEDVIFTRADPVRSLDPVELQRRYGRGDVVEKPGDAFEEACARGRPVVVAGSIYLAGALRPMARHRAARPATGSTLAG